MTFEGRLSYDKIANIFLLDKTKKFRTFRKFPKTRNHESPILMVIGSCRDKQRFAPPRVVKSIPLFRETPCCTHCCKARGKASLFCLYSAPHHTTCLAMFHHLKGTKQIDSSGKLRDVRHSPDDMPGQVEPPA